MPKLFKTDISSEADLKVCATDIRSEADAVIFETTNEWDATEKLIWYYCDIQNDADKIVYFTQDQWDADIKIYVTDIQSDIEWLDSSKEDVL